MPNPAATTNLARIKVKGSGNVFFNVNSSNFTLTHSNVGVANIQAWATDVKLYPVPATNTFTVETGIDKILTISVFDGLGRVVYSGQMNSKLSLAVGQWPKGVYLINLTDAETGTKFSKSISVL
jgi:hypothetical protein